MLWFAMQRSRAEAERAGTCGLALGRRWLPHGVFGLLEKELVGLPLQVGDAANQCGQAGLQLLGLGTVL
jgi:hypothetical protein